jgi:excisionase family DNA binding protein
MKRPAFVSPIQIADALDITRRTVYRWIEAGELDTTKIGSHHRISADQLAAKVGEDATRIIFDAVAAEASADE